MKRRDVAQFIRILSEIDPRWMRDRFTNGACYELSRLLITAWPEGEQWITVWGRRFHEACHVFTRYGDEFFDIAGPHRRTTILKHADAKAGVFRRMTDEDRRRAIEMNPRRLKEGAA